MSPASDSDFLRELDALFDDSPVDLKKIEGILFKLTRGVVDAILKQRYEDLIAPYSAGFSFLANEIGWRCEEQPENAELHVIKGRIGQLIDVLDIADDTSLSTEVIDAVKQNPGYLKLLEELESREDHEVLREEVSMSSRDIDWMTDHQLVKATVSSITFGPKGQRTLQAVMQEVTTSS